jgi:protein-S-isoprenylcysteine O-methyltransferase Ste14
MERNARFAALIYGVICYALFFATFLYLIGFLGDALVPKSVDTGSAADLGRAIFVDTLLIALFGLQHSVMARPRFKAWLTRFVPQPMERATYVLASSVALIALFRFWQPIGAPVWHVTNEVARAALYALYAGGVATVLYSTFLIDHFDLFGLRQVVLAFRRIAYTEKRFMTPSLYRFIRHPLYVGWFLVFWAAPTMSAGHFLFALAMSGYILLAIPYEERDLAEALGEPYAKWRAETPAFVPSVRGGERDARLPAARATAR